MATFRTFASERVGRHVALKATLKLASRRIGRPGLAACSFAGSDAGALPVPVMIIPGSLTREAIDRLS